MSFWVDTIETGLYCKKCQSDEISILLGTQERKATCPNCGVITEWDIQRQKYIYGRK